MKMAVTDTKTDEIWYSIDESSGKYVFFSV
jgi:hypothetical protein